jgi:hypothetical protein
MESRHVEDQHVPGAKLDAGKPRLDLVLGAFANALLAVGAVGTFGAAKYTDNGWLEVPDGIERYTDAMLRHYLKEKAHGYIDDESGLLHAAHLAWNALARLELMLRPTVTIDMPEVTIVEASEHQAAPWYNTDESINVIPPMDGATTPKAKRERWDVPPGMCAGRYSTPAEPED